MWILSDRAMAKIVGGDFDYVVELAKEDKSLTITQLFEFQCEYESYNGFRKFYNKYLKPIIDSISYIDDDKLIAKIIGKLFKIR
jgi:hypothetical protein